MRKGDIRGCSTLLPPQSYRELGQGNEHRPTTGEHWGGEETEHYNYFVCQLDKRKLSTPWTIRLGHGSGQ